MFTGCQKCLRDERDYFHCLSEHLKLNNVVVNAYFEREIQHLDIRNCCYSRLSQFSSYISFTIRVAQSL